MNKFPELMALVDEYADSVAEVTRRLLEPWHSTQDQMAMCKQSVRDKATLVDSLVEVCKDAARYRWLTADHATFETRLRCSDLLARMGQMSYSAASAGIDAAMATKEKQNE